MLQLPLEPRSMLSLHAHLRHLPSCSCKKNNELIKRHMTMVLPMNGSELNQKQSRVTGDIRQKPNRTWSRNMRNMRKSKSRVVLVRERKDRHLIGKVRKRFQCLFSISCPGVKIMIRTVMSLLKWTNGSQSSDFSHLIRLMLCVKI